MVIDSTGQVGIGTEAPSEALSVQGNFNIADNVASPTKQYRFRTSGSALDIEGAGSDLYFSSWAGAAFTGTQQTFMRGFIGTSGNSYNDKALFVGNATAQTNPMVLVVDHKSTASGTGDPSNGGYPGAIYFNDALGVFRCYETGWTDCLTHHVIELASDVTDNAGACTFTNATGLSFAVASGSNYHYRATIIYTSAATTTGIGLAVNVPNSPTLLASTMIAATTTGQTATSLNSAMSVTDAVGYCATGAGTAGSAGNLATYDGVVRPSTAGTVQLMFATEIDTSAVVVKAGSTFEWW
jgi:hypothetical protein